MLLDPTESWLSRIGRWAFLGAIAAGCIAYTADFDLNKVGGVLQWPTIAIAGYFVIKDLFVRPLQNQILDLSLKIDAMQRQLERQAKSGRM